MKFFLWPLLYISLFLPLRLTLYSSTFLPSRLCHFLPYFTSLHPYIFLFLPFHTLPSPFLLRFFFFLSIIHRHHTPSIIFSYLAFFFSLLFSFNLLQCFVFFIWSPFHPISDSLFLLLPLSISKFFLSFPALLLFPTLSLVPAISFVLLLQNPYFSSPETSLFLQSATFSCLLLPCVLALFTIV